MNTNKQPEYVIRINGEQVDPDNARVSIFDHGFLFGDSIYEVVRTIDGKPFAWVEHLERLRNSARRLSLDLPWSDSELLGEIESVINEKTWSGESYIRIIITRGEGRIDLMPRTCESPNLIIIGRELPELRARLHEVGVVLCLTKVRRNSKLAMDPGIKSGNYLNNVMALIEAREAGANDAVMLNEEGHLTECTTSNFFIVTDGMIRTPPLSSGILAGITREMLVETARNEGIPLEECELSVGDLLSADEIFITGTIKGVVPVNKIIGQAEWEAPPGPVTEKLRNAFYKSVSL